jgi:proteic killer suppression protein
MAYSYSIQYIMIKTFRHKGLQLFFETDKKSGIQAAHANKLSRQLARLHVAQKWEDMNIPGWGLHPLKREAKGSLFHIGKWKLAYDF